MIYLFIKSPNGIACSSCDAAMDALSFTGIRPMIYRVHPGANPVDKIDDPELLSLLAWHEAMNIFTERGLPVLIDPDQGVISGDNVVEYFRTGLWKPDVEKPWCPNMKPWSCEWVPFGASRNPMIGT